MVRFNRSRAALVVALLLTAALAACSDDAPTPVRSPEQDPLVELLVQMGFPREQIVDAGGHFVVDGDMRIDKSGLRATPPSDGKAHPGQPAFQRYASSVASNRRTIRVDLSAVDAVSSSWASAVRAAMSNWNGAPGTGYSFVEGGTTDVTVTVGLLATCVAAEAYLPSSGAPGHTLTINSSYLTHYTAAQQVWIMTHEMGHIIGLTHTDTTTYTKVPGTPDADAGSVMNSGSVYPGCPPAAPNWSSLSAYDQVAVRYLYPATLSASITYPGGTPTVSWNAVNGASSYTLYHVTEQFYVGTGTYQTQSALVGSAGTSTSKNDTSRSYTGSQMCEIRGTVQGGIEETYFYRVEAYWSGGSVTALVPAETGNC